MRRISLVPAVFVATLLATHVAWAAPIAPELQISLTPPQAEVRPGQFVLVFVGGGYPLEVEATVDGEPVPFFWNGNGYAGMVAFNLETPPGTHQLSVTAREASSGRTASLQRTITVGEDNYPRQFVNVPASLAGLLDPAINAAESQRLAEIVAAQSHRLEWAWPWSFPMVAPITSGYGQDRTYNSQLQGRHTGIDFRGPEGAVVYAAAPGIVVSAEPFDIRGNVIMIDHGWGVYTQYAHLSETVVAVGDDVVQGQMIGKVGRTGRTTGTHLHWEVIVNGVPVDPLVWMGLSPRYIQPAIDEQGDGTS